MNSSNVNVEHGCFFRDNERRADYAIVIERKTETLIHYITSLEKLGLELEINEKPEMDITFLTIHIPQNKLKNYSKVYDIGLEQWKVDIIARSKCFKWLETNLEVPAERRGEFFSKHRIMIIHKLLERARFGTKPEEKGLKKLLEQRVIIDAYPLHDGPATLPSDSPNQNDRKLLYDHWARFGCWYKEVPLDLVQKYFGCEIAFYFAWLEFFNLMLLPVAILGLLVFLVNFAILHIHNLTQVNDICDNSNSFMCPRCVFTRYCMYKPISNYCFFAKGNYVFDNYLTVAFAVLMSFWATIFLNLWKRKQNRLKTRWDVNYINREEVEVRHEYLDELKRRKVKKSSDVLEPFLPRYIRYSRMVASISVCFLMILLVFTAVFAVIGYKLFITAEVYASKYPFFKTRSRIIATVTGSIIQVIFIKLFGKVYGKLSIWLTTFENPRTKHDFDISVLYKRYFLAFANNYTALFYLAFIKGRIYRLPYREDIFRVVETDSCQPTKCILTLSIQLAFIMLMKKFVTNLVTIITLTLGRKKVRRERNKFFHLPYYEADYFLLPTNKYLLTTEFSEMIIQFGFVTIFVATFPLAPLCALLNNILEHRLDAMKLVTKYRRPIPKKISGIGAWDGILLGVTYLSTATNAFVIAFTTDYVWRQIYRSKYNFALEGYVNSTLSAFATKEYDLFKDLPPQPDVCYYADKRHPPDHPQRYEPTTDYWVDFAWRLIFVFVFEHIVLVLNGILSYAIPDLPETVKVYISEDTQLVKQAKQKMTNRTKESKSTQSEDTDSWIVL